MKRLFALTLCLGLFGIPKFSFSADPKVEPVGNTVITEKRTFTFDVAKCIARLVFNPKTVDENGDTTLANFGCSVLFTDLKKGEFESSPLMIEGGFGQISETQEGSFKIGYGLYTDTLGYELEVKDHRFLAPRSKFEYEEALRILTYIVEKHRLDGKTLSLLVQYPAMNK